MEVCLHLRRLQNSVQLAHNWPLKPDACLDNVGGRTKDLPLLKKKNTKQPDNQKTPTRKEILYLKTAPLSSKSWWSQLQYQENFKKHIKINNYI